MSADKTDIQNQFNHIAEEYDANRKQFIPCFDDYYEKTTDFIASSIEAPRSIVDLGAGTGLLSYYWYQHFPDSDFMLVDIAEDMLKVAKRRFASLENFSYLVSDYKENLPDTSFDAVISALSIHHLEDSEKKDLFSNIYKALPKGGLFVNYDMFCGGDAKLNTWYDRYWETHIYHSGLTETELQLWDERRKLDRECSVETEIDLIKQGGFETVKCVYCCQKFAVIIAIA